MYWFNWERMLGGVLYNFRPSLNSEARRWVSVESMLSYEKSMKRF
jgi:hypothetical protein